MNRRFSEAIAKAMAEGDFRGIFTDCNGPNCVCGRSPCEGEFGRVVAFSKCFDAAATYYGLWLSGKSELELLHSAGGIPHDSRPIGAEHVDRFQSLTRGLYLLLTDTLNAPFCLGQSPEIIRTPKHGWANTPTMDQLILEVYRCLEQVILLMNWQPICAGRELRYYLEPERFPQSLSLPSGSVSVIYPPESFSWPQLPEQLIADIRDAVTAFNNYFHESNSNASEQAEDFEGEDSEVRSDRPHGNSFRGAGEIQPDERSTLDSIVPADTALLLDANGKIPDGTSASLVPAMVQNPRAAGTPPGNPEENHNLSADCLELFEEWLEKYIDTHGQQSRRPYFRDRLTELIPKTTNKWRGNTKPKDESGRTLSTEQLVEKRVNAFETELKRNANYRDRRIQIADATVNQNDGTEAGTNSD